MIDYDREMTAKELVHLYNIYDMDHLSICSSSFYKFEVTVEIEYFQAIDWQ